MTHHPRSTWGQAQPALSVRAREEAEELLGRMEAAQAALRWLEDGGGESGAREETGQRVRGLYEFRYRRFSARAGEVDDDDGIEQRSLMVPISVDSTPLIGFVLADGHLLLNVNLFDEANNCILRIVNNQLAYSSDPWDVQLVGRNLKVRAATGGSSSI